MFQPNSVIAGRYQVIRLVGQGGMSNLYLAHDRKYNNAIVVVKEMTAAYSDPKEQQMAVELFHREAKLLASLNHRHIPKVYDYFQFAGKYYLSMEFIDGEDLAQKLEATKGPLPEAQVLEWGEQIATVLFYLHKHDPPIVFRDVKPSNIMLCDQGVKLIDFGIARHFDQAKKGDTMRIGSPGYAPPEQYAAQTDPRSDIYALGVTLHHALTGRDPTGTQTPFLVPPARKLNPALSEATDAMLARATQLSPEDRYQNILEMKNDMKQILSRGKQSTRVVGAPPPPPGPAQTPAAVPLVAAAAAAAAGAAAAAAGASGAAAASAQATAGSPGSTTATTATAVAGNPVTPAVTVTPAVATPSKKRRRGKGLLLVALVLLVTGGGLFLAGPTGRQTLLSKIRDFVASLSHAGQSTAPEDTIRDALLSGDPRGLLPLFGNGNLDGLSEDKKALYRLNVLAAEVSNGAPGIVHLLYPEALAGKSEDGLFRGASRALAAINGSGGMNKQLLIVLPRAYATGDLDSVIIELPEDSKRGQRIMIIDADGEAAKLSDESKAKPLFVLGAASPGEGVPWLSTLPAGKEWSSLFSATSLGDGKLLWAVSGEPPAEKAERVEFNGDSDSLNRLLQRSAMEGATVVVEAQRVMNLEGLSQEGKLLLLALGPADLPQLSPGSKAEALILGSPLRQSVATASGSEFYLSPSVDLDPSAARLFDALTLAALTALPDDPGFSGMTLTRTAKGKDQAEVPLRFRWTDSSWIPLLEAASGPGKAKPSRGAGAK